MKKMMETTVATIKYSLTVEVDDNQVFTSEYLSEESLLEEGLRKAQHQIDDYLVSAAEMQKILNEDEEDD